MRLLLADAAFAASAAFALTVDVRPSVEPGWYRNGQFRSSALCLPVATRNAWPPTCALILAATHLSCGTSLAATVRLLRSETQRSRGMRPGKSVTFQIGGNPSLTVCASLAFPSHFFRGVRRGMTASTSAASFRTLGLELCMSFPARLAFLGTGFRGLLAILSSSLPRLPHLGGRPDFGVGPCGPKPFSIV